MEREYDWLGKHYRHSEAFFEISVGSAPVALAQPTPSEVATFVEMRFLSPAELCRLADSLEPPNLIEVLGAVPNPSTVSRWEIGLSF